uniref:RNA helicase n=1 Tax=Neolamprologus brichardi TaxID=32507 RepID=A0A3Q4MTW8_NEOBR
MESETDEMRECLIDCLRPRLKELIVVDRVLDLIHFIENEQKERIRQKARNDGDISAADSLINAVVHKPHTPGWFAAFVDALNRGGCKFAADYMQLNLPTPEAEAENENCVRLIHLLIPSLADMVTEEVCTHCFSKKLLTEDERDRITAEIGNRGRRSGARELLRRIVKCPPGWYSTFLQVLKDTEHHVLYNELTGNEGGMDSLLFTLALEVARSPEKEITLRDYQMEVAGPALEGKNIIVCLPTGSGKTRVAVYITKEHLDRRKAEGKPRKVIVLVNKVPLVEQHYSAEFLPFLKNKYKVERVSGDSQLKISFTEIVKKNDIIICTAQILENYLERANSGEDEGVNLSDLTLIIIDECHHTQKGGVYNHIMMRYLKQKHKNKRLIKEQKEPVPLPQILGLTASPGVGGATKMEKAEEHILRICANLDASRIMTRSQEEFKKEQRKIIVSVEDRREDPFGDVIKKIMTAIHNHAELTPTCDLGSQNYEQWVVQKERQAAKDENQKVRVCAEHLRQYSESLNLSNTIRMQDAFSFLNKYYNEEMKKKTAPEEEHKIQITDTERFLFNLFEDNKKELETLAKNPEYENDSLSKLRTKILHEFSSRDEARGIIFIKTRRSAIALNQWIQENPKFADIEVKSAYVIGGGDQSVVKPMTSAEQKDVLKKFGNGQVNLLIATTVAEEGLDIPACNFVIRYGLVTNEIAMIQAQGRGRAEDSSYTLVEVKNSGVAEKECVNEYRKKMMNKAIQKIKSLNQAAYEKRITEFQIQAIMEEKVRMTKKKQKDIKNESPSNVKFSCRSCSEPICTGDDIQIIENMHRVNVTPQFRKLYIQRENTTLQERLLDYETNGFIACKNCGQRWGSMMMYKGIECPCLDVKNFVVNLNGKKISKCTKWNEVPIKFSAFDYAEHAINMTMSDNSDDDETM